MVTINLSGWTPEHFKLFVNHLAYNRLAKAAALLPLVVTSWDLDGDPTDPKTYEAMSFVVAAPLMKEVEAEVVRLFQEVSVPEGLVIDLKPWTMDDFQKYSERVSRNDFPGTAKYLAPVVVAWPWEGEINEESLKGLNIERFGTITKAVGQAINDSFRAG